MTPEQCEERMHGLLGCNQNETKLYCSKPVLPEDPDLLASMYVEVLWDHRFYAEETQQTLEDVPLTVSFRSAGSNRSFFKYLTDDDLDLVTYVLDTYDRCMYHGDFIYCSSASSVMKKALKMSHFMVTRMRAKEAKCHQQ